MHTPCFRILALALLLTACWSDEPPSRKRVVRVGGSASARDVIERLAEGFQAAHPGSSVEHLPSTHSGAALEALRHGELDVAYLTREPSAEERAGLHLYPFAKDPLVFAIRRGAGILDLTTRELRDLYSGRIRDWSELGGAEIPVILLDRPDYTSPKRLLLAGPLAALEIAEEATLLEGPDLMDEALGAYAGAIGYTSLRSALALGDRVDVIRLNGVYPDAESVRSGDYRLTRTLTFATRAEAVPVAKEFLEHAASEEGRHIVENSAMVPVRRALTVAVPPMRNIVAIEVKYGALSRYLQRRLGRPVDLVHKRSYTDLAEAFRKNQVDAAFLGSFSYLVAHLEAGVEVLARPDYNGVSHYRGVIYVRSESPYQELEDLRGARVAHAGKATTAGYIFPLYALTVRGLPPPGEFFGEFSEADSHEAALRAVLEGRADAAAAKDLVFIEMVEEDPSLEGRLRELLASPPVPSNGFAAGPLISHELKDQIRGLLLSMDQSPLGRKALGSMGAQRFIPTTDADYGNLYDMVGQVSDQLAGFFQYR